MKSPLPSLVSRLFGRGLSELSPLKPFVAIGDIHGCADLLDELLTRLAFETPSTPIVFVGDYIDRGPDSARVLTRLMALSEEYSADVCCLMGNHEAMCLDFLEAPAELGHVWLRSGGRQTLESFGVHIYPSTDDITDVRNQLVAKMGPEMIRWLRDRPMFWQSGNVVVSHAGGNPKASLNPRRAHGLLWGHRDTLSMARRDGNWMVHGHFITSNPRPIRGRIPVDTGAFRSGVLTAAIVDSGNVRFVQVGKTSGSFAS